jgi:hypothetical protein
MEEYLAAAGRDSALPGWQYRQLVHALQLLFTQAQLIWAEAKSTPELLAGFATVSRYAPR